MRPTIMVPNNDMNVRPTDEQEKKKLRNRLSQRAFRRRQAEYVKELRKRADTGSCPQSEAIKSLQEENSHLRKQLVEVQSKLSRLIATMQSLSGSISGVLGEPTEDGSKTRDEGIMPVEHPRPSVTQDDLSGLDLSGSEVIRAPSTHAHSQRALDFMAAVACTPEECLQAANIFFPKPTSDSLILPDNFDDFSSLSPQIPKIWNFEYQMGLQPYASALNGSQQTSMMLGKHWTETNSPFSDHIGVLRQLMRAKIEQIRSLTRQPVQFFYQQVLAFLALFNSLTRPDAMAWYAKTRFYYIVQLTAWQLYPSVELFNKVHEQYRPTKLQLQQNYPSVIDWIPFPSVRDRLIQLHAANPQIDQIFCDAVSSYVVEACMSDLVKDAPPAQVYLRVTDVFASISSPADLNEVDPFAILPAPDVASLFSSSECAQAVFRLLNMDHGLTQYKLDPSFFDSYPELFDPNTDITAKGIPLRPNIQIRLTYPKPLDSATFQTYRSFMEFSLYCPMTLTPTTI